jgi:hypothetical protein
MDEWGAWKWPEDVYPESYTLTPQSHTMGQESPFTRKRRTVRLTGDRWVYEMAFRMNRVRSQRLEALLGRLRGPSGRVALWDLDRETPLGANRAASAIFGLTRFSDDTQFSDGKRFSGGTGPIRIWGNWPLGVERVMAYGLPQWSAELVGGDQIGLAGRLYRLTRDAEADGLGKAWLYLHRPLLAEIAHNGTIVTTRPTSPFALEDDNQAARARSARGLPGFTLRFVEVL